MDKDNDMWVELPCGTCRTMGTNHRFSAAHVARLLIGAGTDAEEAIRLVRSLARAAELARAEEALADAKEYLADAERRLAIAEECAEPY